MRTFKSDHSARAHAYKQSTTVNSKAMLRFFRATFVAGILPAFLLILCGQTSAAGTATWKTLPGSSDWNTATNWTPETVPNSPEDTAMFASSTITNISLTADIEVAGIVFGAGASAFAITASPPVTLTISGLGIINNSGIAQNFTIHPNGDGPATLVLDNSAAAGTFTVFTLKGATVIGTNGGVIMFAADATADSGTFLCEGGEVGGAGAGFIIFSESSTASDGSFTTNAAEVSLAAPGTIHFLGTSTAANGDFINNASGVNGANGGTTNFFQDSTAGSGSFATNGGRVKDAFGAFMGFFDTSNADNATLIVNGGTNGGDGGRVVFLTIPPAARPALSLSAMAASS